MCKIQFRSYPINFTWLIYPNSTSWSTDSPWKACSIKKYCRRNNDGPISLFFLSISPACTIRIYELQAGELVHCMEKIVRARIRWRSVSYCSIGIYVLDARFVPSSGRQLSGSICDVHCAISGEIVERITIKLYRISEYLSVPAILELSVIDGPWRTYRLLIRSQNYSTL